MKSALSPPAGEDLSSSGKLVILDRDGVLNEDSESYIKSPDEWIPITTSIEAVGLLTRAGYRVAVATNQSGIYRGLFSLRTLDLMHEKMRNLVGQQGGRIDYLLFCPHGPGQQCGCRKPKPGMLFAISRRFNIAPAGIVMVGDSFTDYQAAAKAGMQFVLVKTGKGRRTLQEGGLPSWVPVCENLLDFVTTNLGIRR